MDEAPQGTAHETLADARRHIGLGKQHVQASQARLTRAQKRVVDSLVRIAWSTSRTFRNLE